MNRPQLDAAVVFRNVIFGQARGAADPLRQAFRFTTERLPGNFFRDRHVGFDQQLFGGPAFVNVFAGGRAYRQFQSLWCRTESSSTRFLCRRAMPGGPFGGAPRRDRFGSDRRDPARADAEHGIVIFAQQLARLRRHTWNEAFFGSISQASAAAASAKSAWPVAR